MNAKPTLVKCSFVNFILFCVEDQKTNIKPTLAQRLSTNANHIRQPYNHKPTLAQRSHAIWALP